VQSTHGGKFSTAYDLAGNLVTGTYMSDVVSGNLYQGSLYPFGGGSPIAKKTAQGWQVLAPNGWGISGHDKSGGGPGSG
jgi:hypothetical protein